jgi:ABC-type multidrug transport system ATPase subunit
MLDIRNLVVDYSRRFGSPVLRGVNLTIDAEKAVIVGPNGSGKSTLFKAILGLAPISDGTVRVFGKDVKDEKGELRVSTNLVEAYRLAYVKCRDLVKIFAELKGGDPAPAFSMIHSFELDPILEGKFHELSTGQQKMLANILAISFSPKLVLLDEPFDNVDEGRRRRFVDILKGLDASIIVITHELMLASRLQGWQLYFMLDGKLWGRFDCDQLDRLYLTRGEAEGALRTMETSLGMLSVTLDHGDVAIGSASSVNALLGKV